MERKQERLFGSRGFDSLKWSNPTISSTLESHQCAPETLEPQLTSPQILQSHEAIPTLPTHIAYPFCSSLARIGGALGVESSMTSAANLRRTVNLDLVRHPKKEKILRFGEREGMPALGSNATSAIHNCHLKQPCADTRKPTPMRDGSSVRISEDIRGSRIVQAPSVHP